MFEQRRSGGWSFNWAGIVLVVVFVLAVFWLFRQNPPPTAAPPERKMIWTSGPITSGELEIEANGYLSYPLDLNKRSVLKATFTTGDSSRRLVFSVFEKSDLERWKAGDGVRFVTNTGLVPRGTIERVVEPGYYVIVFDNRANDKPIRVVGSDVSVE